MGFAVGGGVSGGRWSGHNADRYTLLAPRVLEDLRE